MIISRTPFRISFFGGGTDYPEYFNEHGGVVLATSINKYCYVGVDSGKMWSHSDLPVRSGMATSSAFTVGLLKACTDKSNEEIAGLATIWERDKLDGHVGYQDQYICAMGGFRRLRFYASGIVDEEVDYRWLEPYLMLFDTGQYRSAGKIVEHQLERVDENQDILHQLKEVALNDYNTPSEFGAALDMSWQLKKKLADDVSSPLTDTIYDKALKAGAIGGKLLGAGGGGFIVFVVEPDKQDNVGQALKIKQVEFKFDTDGAKVIYCD
ncbi:hypothetical protein LCGC14_0931480 [marine sediment metagenome]|uniref:GHMP kinase C-terminal domain-containing protein n=1 Tax=marine sediment metagenome TaxID=412755 RepID=A0A0F9NSG6_9ZZZZ